MFHLQDGGLQCLLRDGVERMLDLGQDGAPVLGAPGLAHAVQTQVALGDAAVTRVCLLERGLTTRLCPLGERLHGLGLGHLAPVLSLPTGVLEAGPALALGPVTPAGLGAQAVGPRRRLQPGVVQPCGCGGRREGHGRGRALADGDDAGLHQAVVGVLGEDAALLHIQVVQVPAAPLRGQPGLLLLSEPLEEPPDRVVRRQDQGGLVLPFHALFLLPFHIADLPEHDLEGDRMTRPVNPAVASAKLGPSAHHRPGVLLQP